MAKKNSIQIQNINNADEKIQTVDVLYQKMGDRWYAFSMIGDEMFVGSVSEAEINQAASQEGAIEKILVEPTSEALHEAA